jgi:hypothetical protein
LGRVPRDEYEALRSEGWTSTPKQACDFVATWTPSREDTALSYAGIILDEDQSPEDRAADRAERFGGYLDKRLDEATGHADRYESGPSAHGYQNAGKAERAAARHDRIGTRAVDAWGKAEYWQRRTAGVISHALYVSSPSVRMGRIKTLEAEIRQIEANYTPHKDNPADGGKRYGYDEPHTLVGQGRAVHFVATSSLPEIEARYARTLNHLRLRLAYENQMIEAQGGRLADVEMEKGGRLGGRVIAKVSKSPKTGRVTSVAVIGPRVEGWAYQVDNVPGTEFALYTFKTERLAPGSYTEPTDESRAELAAFEAAAKAARNSAKAKTPACPLINPTDEDAERLQAVWNAADGSDKASAPMTQAEYSARSGGGRGICETKEITGGGTIRGSGGFMRRPLFPAVAKVRSFGRRVVVITDKPQKAIPAAVWHDPRPETVAEVLRNVETLRAAVRHTWLDAMTEEESRVFRLARMVGITYADSASQFGFTPEGIVMIRGTEAVTV